MTTQTEYNIEYYEHWEKYWIDQALIAKDEEERKQCLVYADYCASILYSKNGFEIKYEK